jgi:hypothetical protein
LIDGQQRMTTLILIGLAAKDYHEKWNNFLNHDRLQLYGRPEDQKFLKNAGMDTNCNQKMVMAFNAAKNFLKRKKEDENLPKYIYEHAAFFLSEVPSSYSLMEKNQQFVRMNNRGKQLEQHEILKVQLISLIGDEERKNAFDIWNIMAACLSGSGGKQDDESPAKSLKDILRENDASTSDTDEPGGGEALTTAIVSIPEFLLIALARYCQQRDNNPISHDKDRLIETFHEILLQGNDHTRAKNVNNFIRVLETQVKLLENFFIFINSGSGQDTRYKLGRSSRDDQSLDFADELDGKRRLIVAQSFLYVSTEPHLWLVSAFNWCSKFIYKKVDGDFLQVFIRELEKTDNEQHPLPSNEIRKNWSYGHIDRYWFWKLDYILWEKRKELFKDKKDHLKAVEKYVFRQNRSIEHLHPQNQPKADQWEETALHSFGNLAMISASFNSQQSDDRINTKFGRLRDQLKKNELESIKLLCMFNVAQEKNADWTPDASKAHCKTMLDILGNWYNGVEQTKPVCSELSEPADGDHGDQVPPESAHISTREKPEAPPTSG